MSASLSKFCSDFDVAAPCVDSCRNWWYLSSIIFGFYCRGILQGRARFGWLVVQAGVVSVGVNFLFIVDSNFLFH